MGGSAFSKDGKLLVYSIQRAGSDWQEAFLMNALTKEKLSDNLNWLKFTGFSWKGNEGFYYSRYPEPEKGDKLKGKNVFQAVYYHRIGTPQSDDIKIYEDKEHPQAVVRLCKSSSCSIFL